MKGTQKSEVLIKRVNILNSATQINTHCSYSNEIKSGAKNVKVFNFKFANILISRKKQKFIIWFYIDTSKSGSNCVQNVVL